MAHIADIETTTNTEKHPQAVETSKGVGQIEKTDFEKLKERAVSIREAREHTIAFINRLRWKE